MPILAWRCSSKWEGPLFRWLIETWLICHQYWIHLWLVIRGRLFGFLHSLEVEQSLMSFPYLSYERTTLSEMMNNNEETKQLLAINVGDISFNHAKWFLRDASLLFFLFFYFLRKDALLLLEPLIKFYFVCFYLLNIRCKGIPSGRRNESNSG